MEFLLEYGYIGLFVASFLAATVIPLSADILFVAFIYSGANPALAITAATMGNWLGGMSSYYIGYVGKWEWIEKYLRVKREKIERQKDKIDKYSIWLALFTWLPIVGDLFAVALGFYKIKILPVAIFMLIGKGSRFIIWGIITLLFN